MSNDDVIFLSAKTSVKSGGLAANNNIVATNSRFPPNHTGITDVDQLAMSSTVRW